MKFVVVGGAQASITCIQNFIIRLLHARRSASDGCVLPSVFLFPSFPFCSIHKPPTGNCLWLSLRLHPALSFFLFFSFAFFSSPLDCASLRCPKRRVFSSPRAERERERERESQRRSFDEENSLFLSLLLNSLLLSSVELFFSLLSHCAIELFVSLLLSPFSFSLPHGRVHPLSLISLSHLSSFPSLLSSFFLSASSLISSSSFFRLLSPLLLLHFKTPTERRERASFLSFSLSLAFLALLHPARLRNVRV